MTTLEGLIENFPFPEIRDGQQKALDMIATAYDLGKRFVVIEAPTGSGKSGIAKAVTDTFHGYILTPQKMLTAQYVKEFRDIAELKGRANYDCIGHGVDCDIGGQLQARENRPVCENCPYRIAKENFCTAVSGTANFAYFLTERQYVGNIPSRPVLVIDEGHNTEEAILSQINFDVNAAKAINLGLLLPDDLNGKEAQSWVQDTLLGVAEVEAERAKEIAMLRPKDKDAHRKARSAESFFRKVKFFAEREDIEDWLLWTDRDGFHAKPLSADRYAEERLFGAGERLIVILSATILDFAAFRKGLGITNSCLELRLSCDFDVSNRQILYTPAGSMVSGSKKQTIPLILRKLRKLLNYHANDKGIVHCHTQELSKAIAAEFWDEDRLIFYENGDNEAKERALKSHFENPGKPTVLVAQSMYEGLDLREDLSRFQAILKVPYPYLGDKYILEKKKRNPGWFDWQTALKLVQATGRSVRSRDDWAFTYVLDQDFQKFVTWHTRILPKWWKDAINWKPRKSPPKKPVASVRTKERKTELR